MPSLSRMEGFSPPCAWADMVCIRRKIDVRRSRDQRDDTETMAKGHRWQGRAIGRPTTGWGSTHMVGRAVTPQVEWTSGAVGSLVGKLPKAQV